MQDYLQHLKEEDRENEILELIKIENYTDNELLEYANKEKIKNLKESTRNKACIHCSRRWN